VLAPLDLRGVDVATVDLPRPPAGTDDGAEPVHAVRSIIAEVRAGGDAALLDLTERFDGVRLASLTVPAEELTAALDRIPADVRAAIEAAAAGIDAFHRTQVLPDHVHERDGFRIASRHVPVDRAGCYVPGGRAKYPSTVLMTAIPARVAGVPEVVLCVPPGRDGKVPDVTLAAAAVAGVDAVHPVGGAQAVAALAYGTESIPAVDVIVGPGNVYVAVAKREVAGDVGVAAAFAGPSEIVVVADGSVDPSFAAVDVVVQAEHGPGGLAWLITADEQVAKAVTTELERLVDAAPRREDIEATLDGGGYAVVVDDLEAAMVVANRIAPEHLQLMVEDPAALVPLVRHAGAVFAGPLAPASLGDYVAGPSHVLPTAGTARFAGALTVADFQKPLHVVEVSEEGFLAAAPHVAALALAEGLDEHARSVTLRQAALADDGEGQR
jgi:histidinol dehydrogenase